MSAKSKWTALLLTLLTAPLFASAMSRPSSLINIPIANEFGAGDIEFGTAIAFDRYSNQDIDLMLNIAPTQRLKLGATWLHEKTLVYNFHGTLFHGKIYKQLMAGFSSGLRNISAKPSVSSRREYPLLQKNTTAPYLSAFFGSKDIRLHFGVGGRGFQGVSNPLEQGYFGGVEFLFSGGQVLFEHDGKDLNFGLRLMAAENADFTIALTEYSKRFENEQYNNAPGRMVTFGFRIRQNIKTAYYEKLKQVRTLEKNYNKTNKELTAVRNQFELELKQLYKTRRILEKDIRLLKLRMEKAFDRQLELSLENEHALSKNDRVLDLYSRSFDAYAKQDYPEALSLISRAIRLEPKSSEMYSRLGSIYFKMGKSDLALDSWEVALQLDPNNTGIKQLIQSIKAR